MNNNQLKADCEKCFGLCCVGLPFAKSADFAYNKDGSTPCKYLKTDYKCSIHESLREKGFKGCVSYDCFGAGQKVSQGVFKGMSWNNTDIKDKMFTVFTIVQQLHELLYYINEALHNELPESMIIDLRDIDIKTESLTILNDEDIIKLNLSNYRSSINHLLNKASEHIREPFYQKGNNDTLFRKLEKKSDHIGVNFKGMDLRGINFRGALLIVANLSNSDMRLADMRGADLRDADLSGTNLSESIFLTQAQINSARGNKNTLLPNHLYIPKHWLN